jgi:two-component system OmpR family response regulator
LFAHGRRHCVENSKYLACDELQCFYFNRPLPPDEVAHNLSTYEYRTLVVLLERQGRLVTREDVEDAVYGSFGTIESNTIAVFVHNLRRKLGEDIIATVRGCGYRIGESR